jgi:tRNA uridine 5-carboxymethylaminomethyl modification enzyme
VAGVNAAIVAKGRESAPFTLGRHEAYLGVMIDDLVTLGTDEPYRLLSSRAEYRLLLGADSAYARLTGRAVEAGLFPGREAEAVLEREARVARVKEELDAVRLTPDRLTRESLAEFGITLSEETTAAGLARRPRLSLEVLRGWLEGRFTSEGVDDLVRLDSRDLGRIADDLRYDGFLRRERETLERVVRAEGRAIPERFVFRGLPGLSAEAAEKLERHRPRTLGQASRIPGVPPSATTVLLARLASDERRGA